MGIGAMLQNSRGKVLYMFSMSVGVRNSKEAEVLEFQKLFDIFQGFSMASLLWRVILQIWLLGCPIVKVIFESSNFSIMRLGSCAPTLMFSSFMCSDRHILLPMHQLNGGLRELHHGRVLLCKFVLSRVHFSCTFFLLQSYFLFLLFLVLLYVFFSSYLMLVFVTDKIIIIIMSLANFDSMGPT